MLIEQFSIHASATRGELLMARTFNKVLRSVERFVFCSLIAIAVPLNAQQAATATWAGVVRTGAGQAVPGAKVTVSTMGKNRRRSQDLMGGL
jgi:hypothetical protein